MGSITLWAELLSAAPGPPGPAAWVVDAEGSGAAGAVVVPGPPSPVVGIPGPISPVPPGPAAVVSPGT